MANFQLLDENTLLCISKPFYDLPFKRTVVTLTAGSNVPDRYSNVMAAGLELPPSSPSLSRSLSTLSWREERGPGALGTQLAVQTKQNKNKPEVGASREGVSLVHRPEDLARAGNAVLSTDSLVIHHRTGLVTNQIRYNISRYWKYYSVFVARGILRQRDFIWQENKAPKTNKTWLHCLKSPDNFLINTRKQ